MPVSVPTTTTRIFAKNPNRSYVIRQGKPYDESITGLRKVAPRASVLKLLLLLTSFHFVVHLTNSNRMPSISNGPARSHSSAGRITAGLLLSFLALSPLSAVLAASPDPLRATHITDNILAPGPFIGGGSGDGGVRGGGAHTFVSFPEFPRALSRSLKLLKA